MNNLDLRRAAPTLIGIMLMGVGGLIVGCANLGLGSWRPAASSGDGVPSVDPPPRGIALVIGDFGPGSAYVVGASPEKIQRKDVAGARAAAERSRVTPATTEDARRSDNADLNGDGFVTVDEIVALRKAGYSDDEMIDRIRRSGQIFVLTGQQQDYFRDRGITPPVIDAMMHTNPTSRPALASAPVAGRY